MPKPKAFLKESKSKKKTAQQVCRTVDMTLMTTYIHADTDDDNRFPRQQMNS